MYISFILEDVPNEEKAVGCPAAGAPCGGSGAATPRRPASAGGTARRLITSLLDDGRADANGLSAGIAAVAGARAAWRPRSFRALPAAIDGGGSRRSARAVDGLAKVIPAMLGAGRTSARRLHPGIAARPTAEIGMRELLHAPLLLRERNMAHLRSLRMAGETLVARLCGKFPLAARSDICKLERSGATGTAPRTRPAVGSARDSAT